MSVPVIEVLRAVRSHPGCLSPLLLDYVAAILGMRVRRMLRGGPRRRARRNNNLLLRYR